MFITLVILPWLKKDENARALLWFTIGCHADGVAADLRYCVIHNQEAGWRGSGQVGQAGQAVGRRAGQKLLLYRCTLLLGNAVEE